jgi:Mn-dependent DtxR family transcriptional regulator
MFKEDAKKLHSNPRTAEELLEALAYNGIIDMSEPGGVWGTLTQEAQACEELKQIWEHPVERHQLVKDVAEVFM